jgi:PPP family 3-phenylpropionic acid transporter
LILPGLRLRSVAALYFAYFAFVGAFSPYLALWFAAEGMSIAQIGELLALPQALRIVAPPCWGWLADRSGRHVHLLRFSALATVASALALSLAEGYPGFILVMLLLFFATSAQGPLTEALALGLVRGDPGRYGQVRLWGSVGFISAVASTGPWLDLVGIHRLPQWMAALAAMLLLVTLWIPAFAVAPAVRDASRLRERWLKPAAIALLIAAFWMVFAHAALYSFYSLHLERLGYSRTAIGVLWAVGVAAEIGLFLGQRRLFDHFAIPGLLVASFVGAVLRFVLIAWASADLGWLVFAQLLHALTFGVHHSASVAMLHRWFANRSQASAQAVYAVVAYGFGGTAGGLCAAWLWQAFGPAAMWWGAAAASVLGLACALLVRRLA